MEKPQPLRWQALNSSPRKIGTGPPQSRYGDVTKAVANKRTSAFSQMSALLQQVPSVCFWGDGGWLQGDPGIARLEESASDL